MTKNRLHINVLLFSCIIFLPLVLTASLQLWQVFLSLTPYSRMESRSVVTVTASAQDVIWREEGREVTIKGEYFDLISWDLKGYTYTFTGVFDEEETAASNLLHQSNERNNSLIRLMAFSQCFAAVYYYQFQFPEAFLFIGKEHLPYREYIPSPHPSQLLRPPRFSAC